MVKCTVEIQRKSFGGGGGGVCVLDSSVSFLQATQLDNDDGDDG